MMMNKPSFRLPLLLFIVGCLYVNFASINPAFAQGYEIQGKIAGVTDTIQFAYYFAERKKILLEKKVPVQNQSKGLFTVSGSEKLKHGIYVVILPGKGYFELVINDDQEFSFETDTSDFIANMQIEGHEENQVFYEHLKNSTPLQVEVQKQLEKYQAMKDTSTKAARKLRVEAEQKSKEIQAIKEKLIKDHPDFTITKVITMMDEPQTPEMPEITDKKARDKARFYYYRNHFLDQIDFEADWTIRTPVLLPKLEKFKELHTQQADSLIKMVDQIISKTGGNQEMYKFLVNHYARFAEKTKVMCMEKLKWHMYKRYYLDDPRTDWLDSAAIKKVQRYEYMMRLNHCGDEGQNLIMQDTNDKYHVLHQIPAKYKAVVFWSATCGHCKKSMPKLHEAYLELKDKFDLEVYSVHIDKPEDKWKEFINKHQFTWIDVNDPNDKNRFRVKYNVYSTPTFFLLDENNTIIGKRFDEGLLEKILTDLEKKEVEKEANK